MRIQYTIIFMELYKEESAKIKSLLKENPRGMSVTDISKKVAVNRNTVAKYLELLRISGHIEMENVGTAKVYFLSQRIPVSTLLNFSSDFIVVIDDNNRIVQANDRFTELAKVSKSEIQGKKLCDVFPPMISNKTLLDSIKHARNTRFVC
jgi:transcriptional regulator with PAS, ATPase and Fis domain